MGSGLSEGSRRHGHCNGSATIIDYFTPARVAGPNAVTGSLRPPAQPTTSKTG